MKKENKKLMEKKQSMVSHDRLLELLHYDPATGVFTNKINRGTRSLKGCPAGYLAPDGYVRVVLDKSHYPAHRLAWFYTFSEWPIDQIDHINHVRNDNRILNLRAATHYENIENRKYRSEKQSGIPGINWKKKDNSWAVIYKGERLCCVQTVGEGIKILSDADNGVFKKPRRLGSIDIQSGVKGIIWDKSRDKWKIYLGSRNVGRRKTLNEAIDLQNEYIGKPA